MRNWKKTFAKFSLSLTGHEVIPDDIQACHHLKKKGDYGCKTQIQETETKNPY